MSVPAGVHDRPYNLLAPAELADPYPTWGEARSEYPVFRSGITGIWYLTRHADIVAALRNPQAFSSAFAGHSFVDDIPASRRADLAAAMVDFPDPSRFLVTSDAPEHSRRRGLSQVAFSPGRVRALEPMITSIATSLCDRMESGGQADLMADFAYPLSTRVIAGILGLDDALVPSMQQVSEDLLVLSQARGVTLSDDEVDAVLTRVARIAQMHRGIARIVTQRRAHGEDDLITALLEARLDDGSQLDDVDVIALTFELMLAGTDTTANLIAHAVLYSAATPSWPALAGDRRLTESLVEETLRRRGSSKGLFRVTMRDVEVDGVVIPQGSLVHLLYGSANHDEAVFSCPRDVDLERPTIRQHVAFGYGAHFCLGAPLARLETCVALQVLSARFPLLRAPDADTLVYLPAMTTHTLREFPVTWVG